MPRLPNISYDIDGWPADLSPSGATAILEAAVDEALHAHRQDALPRHFTREALTRYPDAYRYATPGPNPKNKVSAAMGMERNALSAWLKAQSPEQRRNYFAQWRRDQRERLSEQTAATRGRVSTGGRQRSQDRANQIPLVDTGAYRSMVLRGGGDIRGPAWNRTMRLQVPLLYAHVVVKNWKGGGLNKTKAVQATTTDEQDAFAARMDAALQASFSAIP